MNANTPLTKTEKKAINWATRVRDKGKELNLRQFPNYVINRIDQDDEASQMIAMILYQYHFQIPTKLMDPDDLKLITHLEQHIRHFMCNCTLERLRRTGVLQGFQGTNPFELKRDLIELTAEGEKLAHRLLAKEHQ